MSHGRGSVTGMNARSSKNADWVLRSHLLGYRVDDLGAVMGLRGARRCRVDRDGYYTFNVRIAGECRPVRAHMLAAFQVHGEAALAPGIQIRHLDGNRLNNAATNLAIGSPTDNYLDRTPAARQAHAMVAARARRRLSFEQVEQVRARVAAGEKQGLLADELGLSPSTVCDIVAGRTYKTA